jgi:cyanophycin synthetase
MLLSVSADFLITDPLVPGTTDADNSLIPLSREMMWEFQQTDNSVGAASTPAPFIINIGSGSTGKPKLIPYTHELFLGRSSRILQACGVNESDLVATHIHLNFVTAKVRLLGTLALGGKIALINDSGKDPISNMIDFGVDVLLSTVFHLEKICQGLPPETNQVWKHLKCLNITSSTVSGALRRKIGKLVSQNLYVTYGSNECGVVSCATPKQVHDYPDTVGKILTDSQVEIVDNNGLILPTGTTGLIRIKTPTLAGDYVSDSETSRVAYKNRWFYPGDLGRLTTDGHLLYRGRSDHMMIMNGINIYPAEIEAVISSHPAIRDVAAVPLSHPVHQDVPVCAVALNQGNRVSQSALMQYATERLGARGPKKFFVLNRIPRNEQGKLNRKDLYRTIRTLMEATAKKP